MIKLFKNFDWVIFVNILILLVFGLMIINSVAPKFFFQQLIYAFLGLFLFFLFSQIDYRIYLKFSWPFYFGSLIILLMTILFGTITRGAVRWLQIGSLTIQPSELVKPFLILFFAWFFSRSDYLDFKKIVVGGLLLIPPVLLIFLQPDLGSSLVVVFLWLGIVLAAGISWRWLIMGIGFLVLFLPLVWQLLKDYQQERIATFLNPFADPLGAGYNLIQATIAVGAGGLFGRGLGKGTQSHLKFLPERHSDFIFASAAEELGFLGALILIFAFLLLLVRILNLAKKSTNRFEYLICIGVFSLFFVQIFINIGMNLGLLPITGINLPFISQGGSSLVATMISFGIIVNIARFTRKNSL